MFWHHGSTQPTDLTQYSNAGEVQSCDSQVIWSKLHKDINSGKYYGSMVQSEATWPSSPPVNVSSNAFKHSREDNTNVCTSRILNDFTSPVPSRPMNGAIHDPVENDTKSVSSGGCRLFGINLTSNCSTVTPPLEKVEPTCSTSMCSRAKESTPYEADRVQSLNVSKMCNEKKQDISEAMINDAKFKHVLMPSTRTRIKVLCQVLL